MSFTCLFQACKGERGRLPFSGKHRGLGVMRLSSTVTGHFTPLTLRLQAGRNVTSSLMPLHGAVLRTASVYIQSVKHSLNRLSTVNTNGQYYQRIKETEVRNQSSGCHRGFKFLTNCNA